MSLYRRCYERALRENPALSKDLRMTFEMRLYRGGGARARVLSDPSDSAALQQCMRRHFSRLRLPSLEDALYSCQWQWEVRFRATPTSD